MLRIARAAVAVPAVVALAACATTTYKSTWGNPDAKAASFAGKRVAAVVITKNESARRAAEDALARQITARGAVGVPSYTLIPTDRAKDKEEAKAKLAAAGVEGIVAMRVVGKDKQLDYAPGMAVPVGYWGGPYYGAGWGGYWGYGWGMAYDPGYLREDTIVTVETLVYSIPQNKLLWAGMSDTTNPSKVDSFVEQLSAGAAREMSKAGLLAGAKK
jgi:hypothetical protein